MNSVSIAIHYSSQRLFLFFFSPREEERTRDGPYSEQEKKSKQEIALSFTAYGNSTTLLPTFFSQRLTEPLERGTCALSDGASSGRFGCTERGVDFPFGKKKTRDGERRETAKKDRRRTEKSYLREKRARACVCVLWCGAVGKSTHEPAPVFVLLSLS